MFTVILNIKQEQDKWNEVYSFISLASNSV